MTLTLERRINGKSDNCSVSANKNGGIYIGSITITAEESDEFLELLRQAINEVKATLQPKPQ